MRLYSAKVGPLSQELVRTLVTGKDIETDAQKEVVADIEAVLKSYLDTEKLVDEKTRELLDRTGRTSTEFPKVRLQIAQRTHRAFTRRIKANVHARTGDV